MRVFTLCCRASRNLVDPRWLAVTTSNALPSPSHLPPAIAPAGAEDDTGRPGPLLLGSLLLPSRFRTQSRGERGRHTCLVSYGGHQLEFSSPSLFPSIMPPNVKVWTLVTATFFERRIVYVSWLTSFSTCKECIPHIRLCWMYWPLLDSLQFSSLSGLPESLQ